MPAWAETVNLSCNHSSGNYFLTVRIDLDRATVCVSSSESPPPCHYENNVRVTDQAVSFGCAAPGNGGCNNPTVIDRISMRIKYPVGTGSCERVKGGF
jgi:hypothetical protein